MRIRRTGLLVLGLLLLPATARATGHNADVGFAPSGADGSTLWGFHTTLGLTSPTPRSHELSFLADLSVHWGTHNGEDVTRTTLMGGARWTLKRNAQYPRYQVSAHVLMGFVHSGAGDGGTAPAVAAGAAVEYLLPHALPSEAGWAVRFQADYIGRPGDGESFFRGSVGVVYRYKHTH